MLAVKELFKGGISRNGKRKSKYINERWFRLRNRLTAPVEYSNSSEIRRIPLAKKILGNKQK